MTATALVPVFAGTLAGQPQQLCNARDLHATLGVGRDFTTWLKERIEQYGFADGEDYTMAAPRIGGAEYSPDSGDIRRGRGKPRTDYHLTLDMAKELAMVENNDRGRQVRRYFIQIEKEAQAKALAAAPANLPALPPRRRIRTRDDLSMTARDSDGNSLNWFVPDRRDQYHEHAGIGAEWFAEVVELAQYDPQEAYIALLNAGMALVPTWNWGHEHGFMAAFAHWAVAAMVEHKGELPAVPFEPDRTARPPREGFEHYRHRAADEWAQSLPLGSGVRHAPIGSAPADAPYWYTLFWLEQIFEAISREALWKRNGQGHRVRCLAQMGMHLSQRTRAGDLDTEKHNQLVKEVIERLVRED